MRRLYLRVEVVSWHSWERARLDAQMQVGALSQTIEVTADTAVLQTETTQVGSVMSSSTIVNTPLMSRNPIALTLLAPGVTTPNPAGFNNGVRTGGGGRPYVNGNREESNNFLLDGVDNNQVSDNLTSYQPNPDAIQEFKTITNNAEDKLFFFIDYQGLRQATSRRSSASAMSARAFCRCKASPMHHRWAAPTSARSSSSPTRLITMPTT
jgi:hypothetical protein